MFYKQLKCFLGVPAGAWSEGQYLLIICNEWYGDSNEVGIKLSVDDIWPPTRYSTNSVKSVVSTMPQILSHITSVAPPPCYFAVMTPKDIKFQEVSANIL
jgi:hypothetical protein